MSGSNKVEVDAAALVAEADAITTPAAGTDAGAGGGATPAESSPAVEGAPGALSFDETIAHYKPAAYWLVGVLADRIAPNWNVSAAEKTDVADASAIALALWFPDLQIPPKYLVLLTLGGALWKIADKRRDDKGNYIPLRIEAKADAAKPA